MKKAVFTFTAVLIASGAAPAAEKLGVTAEMKYLTKWLSKGARAYGSHGALFKKVDVDLYGTGFGFNVTHRNATSSGYVDKQRFDYRPYYKNVLFEEKPCRMDYNISAGYEHYPGLARNRANTTYEWIFAFSWPKLLGWGLKPSYTAHYEYPAGSDYDHSDITGWVHRFGLARDFNSGLIDQPITICSEIAYTDGLGGRAVDHDWSYMNVGASTKLQIAQKLAFIPAVYFQKSMDDSVNEHDELYATLAVRYTF
jgi:hypothetical protein